MFCFRNIKNSLAQKTGREIGAAKIRQEKLEESIILTEYQRAYKRYYARIRKQIWSREQLQRWQSAALAVRTEATENSWSDRQFADQIRAIADDI